MFVMVDYVRKITVKKSCKYCEYRLFEHLLFLCIRSFSFIVPFVALLPQLTV